MRGWDTNYEGIINGCGMRVIIGVIIIILLYVKIFGAIIIKLWGNRR